MKPSFDSLTHGGSLERQELWERYGRNPFFPPEANRGSAISRLIKSSRHRRTKLPWLHVGITTRSSIHHRHQQAPETRSLCNIEQLIFRLARHGPLVVELFLCFRFLLTIEHFSIHKVSMDRIITPSLTSVKCGKSYSLSDQRQRSIASSTSPRETVEFRDISGSNWTVKLPIIDKRINCLSGENNASRNLVEIITESRR